MVRPEERRAHMKIKIIVTGILLLFVGISVGYLVIDESQLVQVSEEPPAQGAVETPRDAGASGNGSKKPEAPEHKVIAYYFHGTARCRTCRRIEAYTEESLRTGFSDELEAGKLALQAVNVETPENEHFVQDYELSTRSVVLVEMLDGKQRQWKNLPRSWELVRDKPSFIAYIQEETRKFLDKQHD